MEFYGVGIQKRKDKTGTILVSVRIPLNETTRIGAVNQAMRIAKRDSITGLGIHPVANRRDSGGILTKSMKAEKTSRNKK